MLRNDSETTLLTKKTDNNNYKTVTIKSIKKEKEMDNINLLESRFKKKRSMTPINEVISRL